jgi:hypothetical protein
VGPGGRVGSEAKARSGATGGRAEPRERMVLRTKFFLHFILFRSKDGIIMYEWFHNNVDLHKQVVHISFAGSFAPNAISHS